MRNKEIRKIIKELDFKYWQVAEKIGNAYPKKD